MKYTVIESYDMETVLTTDDIEEAIERCIEEDYHEEDDYFEEWLNDSYDNVYINGSTYYPYDILNNLDYQNLASLREDYMNMQNEDDKYNARNELTHADAGDRVRVQNYIIEVSDEDEEEEPEEEYYDEETEIDSGDAIEKIRKMIAKKTEEAEKQEAEEKADEDKLMKLFQVM